MRTNQSNPIGNLFSWRGRILTPLLLMGLIGSILAIGCDAENTDGPPATGETDGSSEASAGAVLPQAPWFRLPDDWNEQHPLLSPNAKTESHFLSLVEREIVPNPADGDGRAWLEAIHAIDPDSDQRSWRRDQDQDVRPTVVVSSAQRIELVFEVGVHGIDEGGILFVMADPFWSWSEAQIEDPHALGYTTASSRRGSVELVPLGDGASFRIEGRALESGEQIEIVLGAGPRGTRVDEFADRSSEILIGVDADGDGSRAWIKESARLDIRADRGVAIVAFAPAEVAPAGSIELSIAIVDARGNRAHWPAEGVDDEGRVENTFAIERIDGPALAVPDLPNEVVARVKPGEVHRFRFDAPADEGTLRLLVHGRGALEGLDSEVNPIVIRQSSMRLVWADLHGHSGLSDGTGTPEDYFSYARDVAGLDAIALTDHDHWGVRPIDESPEISDRILQTSLRFHEPGRFVTIPGYEWTSWLHGHRHVLYFNDDFVDGAPIHSSVDFATDRPDELWNALRGKPALTFAHHSSGEPIATNWIFPPDPILEPLTEISSIHGMSEASDAPTQLHGAISGNFIRDVLLRGARLGFIGSGDSHDGHPGLAQLSSGGQAGLAAIFTASLDRSGLLEAMRKRRTFATNGIRPWLWVSIDEAVMGESLAASPDSENDHLLRIRYEATAPIERIDLIRAGRIAAIDGEQAFSLDLERKIPRLRPGEFHYVRIVQVDRGVAWSSPIFVDAKAESATSTAESDRSLLRDPEHGPRDRRSSRSPPPHGVSSGP